MQTQKKKWNYEGSTMDDIELGKDYRQDPQFQKVVEIVEEAMELLRSATWSDLRKVAEQAGVTRARLAAAVESLNLTGTVGIEQKGAREILHYIPGINDEIRGRLYGQRPDFYRSWQKSYVSLG